MGEKKTIIWKINFWIDETIIAYENSENCFLGKI